jgi:Kef-type K+ transport system membrane component KefB
VLFPSILAIGAYFDPPARMGADDPVSRIVLWLSLIVLLAKVAGELATRLGQASVLGELVLGVAIGNLGLLGASGIAELRNDSLLNLLARIGVLVLIFRLGLRSSIARMVQVGGSSMLVAVIGVATPFVLGYGIAAWLLPDAAPPVHAFIAATLTATGIGVIGRVLDDLGLDSREARIIIGAAVIDDILGLTIMAAVGGSIAAAEGGGSSWASAAQVGGKAVLFLGGSVILGGILSPRLLTLASCLRSRGVLLASGLGICFAFSSLADRAGLSPIVGAFAAGLVLEEPHHRRFLEKGERSLQDSLDPIASFLVPIFFVIMGMRVDLRTLFEPGMVVLTVLLTAAAIVGKLACSLGVLDRGADRLAFGFGMMPRGAVGLIFADLGLTITFGGKPILTPATCSAVVVMVMVTTLVALPPLKWRLDRIARREREETGKEAAAVRPGRRIDFVH